MENIIPRLPIMIESIEFIHIPPMKSIRPQVPIRIVKIISR